MTILGGERLACGILSEAKDAIVEVLAAEPAVERAVLFGSRVNGQFRIGSDIDLALFGDALRFEDKCRLEYAMDELLVPQRVDLLVFNSLRNERLRRHILVEGVEWYRREGDCP